MRMVDYINRRALELACKTGLRFIEAKYFVLEVCATSRCIGAHDKGEELNGIVEDDVQLRQDYDKYCDAMKAAGLPYRDFR